MKDKLKTIDKHAIIFLLLALLTIVNAKSRDESAINYSVIESGHTISLNNIDPLLKVFLNRDEYESFYRRIKGHVLPKPSPPDVDFEKNAVIFVSYGEKKTAGYSIELRNISLEKDTLSIKAILISPPADKFQAQVITHPFLFIAVPKIGFGRVELVNEFGETMDYVNIR